MTEKPEQRDELGSDEQMGPDRLDRIQERLDLEQAAIAEEERRTAAQPSDGPG